MPKVFICYRRADTEGHAGRLGDALRIHFGDRLRVFRDLDSGSLRLGDDFTMSIRDAILSSAAVIVVIGSQWLTIKDAKSGGRRLDNEKDHVRVEIKTALEHDVRIIPVLVQGATMPAEDDLPDGLRPLAYKTAHELSPSRWPYDVQQLMLALESLLPPVPAIEAPTQERPERRRSWFAFFISEWKAAAARIPAVWLRRSSFILLAGLAVGGLIANRDRIFYEFRQGVNSNDAASPTPAPSLGDAATPQPAPPAPAAGNVSGEFMKKVRRIAANLGTDPDYLTAVMGFQTGGTFSPSIKRPNSGAVGLLLFMPTQARALGTTTDELAEMTAERQLDYVERYYAPFKGRLKTIEDVYMALLLPSAVGKGPGFVLFERPSAVYKQNSGLDLNRDGIVTAGEATERVRRRLEAVRAEAAVDTLLPAGGTGFTTYNRERGGADQYGHAATILAVTEVARAWAGRHPDIPLQIGDISRRGGGRFYNSANPEVSDHENHRDGREVDFRPVTNNGRLEPTHIRAPNYSPELTREVVEVIKSVRPAAVIDFNDARLIADGLTRRSQGNDNHLHVRFP